VRDAFDVSRTHNCFQAERASAVEVTKPAAGTVQQNSSVCTLRNILTVSATLDVPRKNICTLVCLHFSVC
jgi:hypothetical protein